jgi:hypothetical protein
LAFPLPLISQTATRSKVRSSTARGSIQSECHLALVKMPSGSCQNNCGLRAHRAFNVYRGNDAVKTVSICNITIVQLREFPGRIFLIWHRIPGGRMQRMN